jgi:hypothetical protein
MDLGQFGMEFLYSAIIALIFTGTGRAWSTITHRRASATTGMQMGQVMGGPPASQPPLCQLRLLSPVAASILGVCCCILASSSSPST